MVQQAVGSRLCRRSCEDACGRSCGHGCTACGGCSSCCCCPESPGSRSCTASRSDTRSVDNESFEEGVERLAKLPPGAFGARPSAAVPITETPSFGGQRRQAHDVITLAQSLTLETPQFGVRKVLPNPGPCPGAATGEATVVASGEAIGKSLVGKSKREHRGEGAGEGQGEEQL